MLLSEIRKNIDTEMRAHGDHEIGIHEIEPGKFILSNDAVKVLFMKNNVVQFKKPLPEHTQSIAQILTRAIHTHWENILIIGDPMMRDRDFFTSTTKLEFLATAHFILGETIKDGMVGGTIK